MFYELELRLIERDVAAAMDAACRAALGDVPFRVEAFDFDASVVVHGVVEAPTARAIVQALRGGRDFDPTRPADWHVRSIDHGSDPVDGDRDGPRTTTTVAFSQTYRAPPGYDEDDAKTWAA